MTMIRSDTALRVGLFVLLLLTQSAWAQPDASAFIQEPDYLDAVLSPDGRYLAQLWNDSKSHSRILSITDLSKQGNPIVGRLGDRVIRPAAVRWATTSRLIVDVVMPMDSRSAARKARRSDDYSFDDHAMVARVLAMDADGGNVIPLIARGMLVRAGTGRTQVRNLLPDDPDHVLIPAYRSGRAVLNKVNVHTGDSHVVTRGGPNTTVFLSNSHGEVGYRLDFNRTRNALTILARADDDKWERVDSIDLDEEGIEDTGERPSLFGISGNDIVYRKINPGTGLTELYAWRVDARSFEVVASDKNMDVLGPIFGGVSDEIDGYVVDGDTLDYRYFDEQTQHVYAALTDVFEPENVRILSITQDRKLATVRVSGLDNPGKYYLYDHESKALSFLRDSHAGLTPDTLGQGVFLKYKARDGYLLNAYAILPPGYDSNSRYATIVLPHGGPHARDRALYDLFAQFLATRGYVVVQPNFRGSTGYGRKHRELGFKQWGRLMQDDVSDALEFLVRRGITDADRVCIAGISYGGYSALAGALDSENRYKCSITINGVTDLVDLVRRRTRFAPDDAGKRYFADTIGHPVRDLDLLKQYSPARRAADISIPVLVIASTHDPIVPASHSRKLIDALERHDVPHQFIELENSGHNPFSRQDEGLMTLDAVERFLNVHNPADRPVGGP